MPDRKPEHDVSDENAPVICIHCDTNPRGVTCSVCVDELRAGPLDGPGSHRAELRAVSATLAYVTAERDVARKQFVELSETHGQVRSSRDAARKERDEAQAELHREVNAAIEATHGLAIERDALRERANTAEIALGIGWENLLRISDENAKEAEEAEARVKVLEEALRKYVDKTACSVALLSRNGAVGPTLRAELAEAESILLGPVAAALRKP